MNEGRGIAILEHEIRCAKAFLDVSPPRSLRLRLVLSGEREIAFGPDLDGALLQRLLGLEHEAEDFVIDVDQSQCLFRHVPVHGRDGCHRIAHEAHGVVERITPVLRDFLDLIVVLLSARDPAGAPYDLAILVSEDCLDAG